MISDMSQPLFYREIQFSRLGGALPEKVGSFVVGIPTKALEEYRKEHPTGEQMQLFAVCYRSFSKQPRLLFMDCLFRSFLKAQRNHGHSSLSGSESKAWLNQIRTS
jgi:hypothetical protein